MRVLHLGFEDPLMPGAGGGSVRTREVNRRLPGHGLEVTVLTTRYPGCVDGLRDGVRYEHVGIGRGTNRLTRLLGYLAALPAALRAHPSADLVVEDFFPPFSSMAVPLWSGRPVIGVVQWLHAREKARQYKVPFHLVERAAVRTHRRLIAVSQGTAERLTAMNPRAIVEVIGNGVDPALFDEPPQAGRDVLCIGRLELAGKGLDLLLQAWARVWNRVEGDLVIAGSGPDDDRVRRYAERLGIAARVQFRGWVSGADKARLISSSRLVVVPSRAETFGLVAVEALAAATPVLAFDIPCLREVVPPQAGRLVPAFDVAALAAGIVELTADAHRAVALGRAGRSFATSYDWDHLAAAQARAYRAAAPTTAAPVSTGRTPVTSQLAPVHDRARRTRIVSPAPREVWRDLLRLDPHAVATQTPEWTDWLCRTCGRSDASRLYEFADGRRLLLPLLGRGAAGLPIAEESLPYGLGYGGPLVPGGEPSADEVAAIVDDLSRRPVLRTVLRPNPLTAAPWAAAAPPGTVRLPYLAHVLDLEGGFEQVWAKRYRPRTRRDVRNAGKEGLEVREGAGSAVVEAFAELNRQAVQRWAEQRDQPLWLARLVDRRRGRVGQLASAVAQLGSMLGTWSAWRDGSPVAVNVTLRLGAQVYGWLTAVDREVADRTHAGALLMSLAVEDACRAGARWLHMGESDPGSGVALFKEGFGGRPVAYEALAFERLPLTAADRRLRAAVGRVTARRSPDRSERR